MLGPYAESNGAGRDAPQKWKVLHHPEGKRKPPKVAFHARLF